MRPDRLASTVLVLALAGALIAPSGASARKGKKDSKDSTAVASTSQGKSQGKGQGQGKGPMTIAEAKQILGITVEPANGQTPQQQEQDETACLRWGAEQAGVKPGEGKDPKAAGDQAAAQVDSATKGVAVKGAAKGAAVGAIMGSFSGNAGSGAAWGAGGGAIAGVRAKNKAQAKAQKQAEEKTKAENEAKKEAVRKHMTSCLEEKGYTVK